MQITLAAKLAANYIIEELKKEGIHILRYDAATTDSIYLKFDYGVLHSLRISNHPGKHHLKYRYNLQTTPPESTWTMDNYPRYWYDFNHIDDLIARIKSDHKAKLAKYGDIRYKEFMQDNKDRKSREKGFWKEAREV